MLYHSKHNVPYTIIMIIIMILVFKNGHCIFNYTMIVKIAHNMMPNIS